MQHLKSFCFLLLTALALVLSFQVKAQDASGGRPLPLSDAEVKSKYQNCTNGYYSGPRPGKTHYTKDKWLWVVTPEFAKNFCMPAEFISNELKGAEAVAYKMVEDQDEERCGWGGSAEVCSKRTEHRFEIYYRNGTIPKERDIPYFHAANLPSRMLISVADREWNAKMKSVQVKPRNGAIGPFESQQFGLQAVADGKIAWPLGTLGPQIYYEEIFQGLDYLAVEGASGFSRLDGWGKSNAKTFVITVNKSKEIRKYSQIPLADFSLIVELPTSIVNSIIANDQARGLNLKEMAQQSMKASAKKTP